MTVLRRFWFFLTRSRRLADLDEEMQLHVEMRAALNQRRGLPPAAAAREARRRFGNQLKLREESRDMWGFSELERMGRDLRYAIRTLFRTPFVTAIAIVSLALGIGATAGIFSVFHQVLLQSLAVPNPSELVNLSAPGPKPGFGSCGRAGDCEVVFSYAMFRDLQKTQTVFTDIAAHVELRRKPRVRGADVERRGAARVWQLFSGAGAAAGAWTTARFERRQTRRRVARGGAQLQLLVVAIWARSNHPQQTDHRQRPEPHHRRRRAEGLRRHDDRHAACRVRPDHAALECWTPTSTVGRSGPTIGRTCSRACGRGSPSTPRARHSARSITPSSMMSKRRCRRT